MRHTNNHPVLRSDYKPYAYKIGSVNLQFDLDLKQTRVKSTIEFICNSEHIEPLVLHGNASIESISINNNPIDSNQYHVKDGTLTLHPKEQQFTLCIVSTCNPQENTSLMGLYASGHNLFTQCEPEGFRRITWFPDRPDVLATYTVTLRADKTSFPTLLSNGNLVSQTLLENNTHEAVWHDPFPKPSYLFALVAGDFDCRESKITTNSGKTVLLQVYSDKGSYYQTEWAMECLKRALKWDEERFGLELDLDRFMIVAVRDFNMGAMENKGLNIFNSSYALACPNTATDQTYRTIEAVIGHEYFHNWTGNRITCRDWFQLSLKEGLTVFREQEFSADMMASGLNGPNAASARAVKRIDDIQILREQQFTEDMGPMAHPIRPDSYQEISNFYTATIYEKGAEIIRMLHTILGEEVFMQGMREYIKRHDGKAVTCDDFVDAMEYVYVANGLGNNLDAFRRWYSQAGTPTIDVKIKYDDINNKATVTLKQNNPPVGIECQNTHKPPLHIPFAIGFTGSKKTTLLELTETSKSWQLSNINSKNTISLLRGFSAPVNVNIKRTTADLSDLALHDSDPVARWQAANDLASKQIISGTEIGSDFLHVWEQLLKDTSITYDYKARVLSVPAVKQLIAKSQPVDPIALQESRLAYIKNIGASLYNLWHETYKEATSNLPNKYSPAPEFAGKRALAYTSLCYMVASGSADAINIATKHFRTSNNLTDTVNSLKALTLFTHQEHSTGLLQEFFEQTNDNGQLIDLWFSLQANALWANVNTIRDLYKHKEFSLKNPNRARSLIFQFCLNNHIAVNNQEGYKFWAEQIIALDKINPEIAARLARGLDNWSIHAEPYRTLMHNTLKKVYSESNLSANVTEVVEKSL